MIRPEKLAEQLASFFECFERIIQLFLCVVIEKLKKISQKM